MVRPERVCDLVVAITKNPHDHKAADALLSDALNFAGLPVHKGARVLVRVWVYPSFQPWVSWWGNAPPGLKPAAEWMRRSVEQFEALLPASTHELPEVEV
jgi:hypothetical protein